MINHYDYLKYIADYYYDEFYEQGYATPGNNGPHGHKDTPVRNTAHFLSIYSFLYKKTLEIKYKDMADALFMYLKNKQSESKSGAIECMVDGKFDHLNGLIGQAWVVEGLLYYYSVFQDNDAIEIADRIIGVQQYSFEEHLWHRIELDGSDIGIDPTYNHNVWFAACASELLKFKDDPKLREVLEDFVRNGTGQDFRTYKDGVLKHSVLVAAKLSFKAKLKKAIRIMLYPVRKYNPRKLDYRYMENAYHIFDMYGFSILQENMNNEDFFISEKYKRAIKCALDIVYYNKMNYVPDYLSKGVPFNVFGYSYNPPIFEYPYVSLVQKADVQKINEDIINTQMKLMFDQHTNMFSKNNPDILTWNARAYEIIRFLDKKELSSHNE